MSRDEINRLLAEKVMGWTEENGQLRVANARVYAAPSGDFSDDVFDYGGDTFIWNPYDNLAQAMMMVADKVIAMGYHFELTYNDYDGKLAWSAAFDESDTWGFQQINSTSACEAICKAALKVVEND